MLTAPHVCKKHGVVGVKPIQNPLNCWKLVKLVKPQRKYEIRLSVMVTKVERIN